MRSSKVTKDRYERKKIAIVNLTGGGMSGGYHKYLCNIVPRMAKYKDVEAILCASQESAGAQNWFDSMPNVRFVSCKSFRFLSLRHDTELLLELEKFSPDVIFVPVERNCRFKSIPVVNMIQNMEPLAGVNKGNPVFERVKNWLRAYYAKRTIKKTDRVIAISKFVKEFLTKKWNISEENIGVVYHGIDNPESSNAIKPSKVSTDWENDFLFTCGSIRPARGLEDIINAMSILKTQSINIRLVIAGETSPGVRKYRNGLKKVLASSGLTDSVCWTGKLNGEEIQWCYKKCGVFVMTSKVEACPNTALEAMSNGCVIISNDNSPMPEIFKKAAVYYSSKDSQSLAKAIKSVLHWDYSQREKMARLAKNRASDFSWDVCAKKTVEELIKVCKY